MPERALPWPAFVPHGEVLVSVEEIPEPREFTVNLGNGVTSVSVRFREHAHAHDSTQRDNNMGAAVVHVIAGAAVSVLVIVGRLLAWAFRA